MAGRFLGSFNQVLLTPLYRVHKGVQGASEASAVHFGENFRNKSCSVPNLVAVGHLFGPKVQIQKDLGHMSP